MEDATRFRQIGRKFGMAFHRRGGRFIQGRQLILAKAKVDMSFMLQPASDGTRMIALTFEDDRSRRVRVILAVPRRAQLESFAQHAVALARDSLAGSAKPIKVVHAEVLSKQSSKFASWLQSWRDENEEPAAIHIDADDL